MLAQGTTYLLLWYTGLIVRKRMAQQNLRFYFWFYAAVASQVLFNKDALDEEEDRDKQDNTLQGDSSDESLPFKIPS